MTANLKALAVVAVVIAACASTPSVPVTEIAPKGALRVAIAVGPSPSAFWAVRDTATGGARGVTVELGKAAAAKLGVPVQFVEYPNSGEITAAASKDAWDISFMPQDAEREKFVDPGPAFVLYDSTFIVRSGSDIRSAAEADREGLRLGAIEGTATSRTLGRTIKHASLSLFPKAEDAQRQLAEGHLDALAMGREALIEFAKRTPGTRVLDDVIQSTGVVVVVPRNRPAARAWSAKFLEQAKSDGTVRRALDGAGFANATVAPPLY
jgi:polar amino acid transport system substrate-binding protein